CTSSSASALISGSSATASISSASAISDSARRRLSMPLTIGSSSLYSFDNFAKSAPLTPAADSAAPSSAWRRSNWSKRDSRTRSISKLDDGGEGGNDGRVDRHHSQR